MVDDIENVLANVRKAYRLISDYNARLLQTINEIAIAFDLQNFEYSYYNSSLSNVWATNERLLGEPRRLLPTEMSYCFSDGKPPRPGGWMLEIGYWADSGFDNFDAQEIVSIRDFPDTAEEAKTTISLSVLIVRKGKARQWPALWDNCYYPFDGSYKESTDASKKLKRGYSMWAGTVQKCNVEVYYKEFNILSFLDEKTLKKTTNIFISDIRNFVEK